MNREPVFPKDIAASERTKGFKEVVSAYSEEEAVREAERCLQCKRPLCISGCPVGIDIKGFIAQIARGDYKGAYFTIREKNNFASICGRVCPAEYQCRKACVLTKKGLPFASREAININFLERFAGDYGIRKNLKPALKKDKRFSALKVAVVGAGPAGLCCAGELARLGIGVVIFEALHRPGGVLRYGIPPFRLPQDILDNEIDYLSSVGVEIMPNVIIGMTKTLDEIFSEGFNAVFLGLGAGVPSFLNIKGENLCNVYSANEFLTRVNLMGAYKFPRFHTPVNVGSHIIVIGGGNTAMDAARVALRLQRLKGIKPNTSIFYRRTENEMPARRLEIEHAKEEGVRFEFLVQPEELIGDEALYVKRLKCLRCELGGADESGRRRPAPIRGSSFDADCDQAIIAVGLKANEVLTKKTPALKVDRRGDIVVDNESMETSVDKVYAGGDIVGGEGTVIEAMGMAKAAARAIAERISKTA